MNNIKFFGIWNTVTKEFQFGICETSPRKAINKLFNKIGKDAYKWRFEIKKLPKNSPLIKEELIK